MMRIELSQSHRRVIVRDGRLARRPARRRPQPHLGPRLLARLDACRRDSRGRGGKELLGRKVFVESPLRSAQRTIFRCSCALPQSSFRAPH
jgi:hypothetical protein